MWLDVEPCPVDLPKSHIATAILTAWNGWHLALQGKSASKEKASYR